MICWYLNSSRDRRGWEPTMTNAYAVKASNHLWKLSITGFHLRTMVTGKEPGIESCIRSWISGAWGRASELGSNKEKSMYSPRRIVNLVNSAPADGRDPQEKLILACDVECWKCQAVGRALKTRGMIATIDRARTWRCPVWRAVEQRWKVRLGQDRASRLKKIPPWFCRCRHQT